MKNSLVDITTCRFIGFKSVRVIIYNNEVWFIAKDICNTIDYKDYLYAISKYVKGINKDSIVIYEGGKPMLVITQDGVLELCAHSKFNRAKKFQEYILKYDLDNTLINKLNLCNLKKNIFGLDDAITNYAV